MLIKEGVTVAFGADNSGLLRGLSANKMAVAGFATGAIAAIAGITAASAKMAAQLEHDIALVATLTGANEKQMASMRKEVKALGVQFGKSFSLIAQANYQAVSGGFQDITKSMAVTRAGIQLSIAGNADLVSSTEIVVKALNAYGRGSEDATETAAQLWAITRDGIVTVEQLGRFLKGLPLTFAQSGIGMHELGAAIATMTSKGEDAASTVDRLRSAIIKLEQNGLTGTLLERVERFSGKGLGELTRVLGDQGAALAIQNLASDLDLFSDNIKKAEDATDDFTGAVATMENTASAEWDRTKAQWADLTDGLGSAAAKAGTVVVGAFTFMREAGGLFLDQLEDIGDAHKRNAALVNRQIAARHGDDFGVGNDGRPPSGTVLPTTGFGGRTFAAPVPVVVTNPVSAAPVPGFPFSAPDLLPGRHPSDPGTTIFERSFDSPAFPGLPGGREGAGLRMPRIDLSEAQKEFDRINKAGKGMTAGAQFAAAGIMTVSNALSTQLVSALIETDSAVGSLVAGLLQTVIQIGTQAAIGSIIPGFGGFASGGFTGLSGGAVHPNEFVFNADAVRNIGLNNLNALQASAGGSISLTMNQTFNGGEAGNVSADTKHGVLGALREARVMGTDRQFKTVDQRWGV